MRTLEDALDAGAAGNGQVVGVVAEAGTGKSRLCFEFLERCRARGMRVYEGARRRARAQHSRSCRCSSCSAPTSASRREDDDRGAREKIAGRMLLLDESCRDALPVVFEFLGVADPERPAPRAGSRGAPAPALRPCCARLIQSRERRRSRRSTLIEDLHWIDAGERGVPRAAGRRASPARRSLLLAELPARSTTPTWMQKSYYRQIPLAPLGREAIARAARRICSATIRASPGWPARSTRAPAAIRSSPRRWCRR